MSRPHPMLIVPRALRGTMHDHDVDAIEGRFSFLDPKDGTPIAHPGGITADQTAATFALVARGGYRVAGPEKGSFGFHKRQVERTGPLLRRLSERLVDLVAPDREGRVPERRPIHAPEIRWDMPTTDEPMREPEGGHRRGGRAHLDRISARTATGTIADARAVARIEEAMRAVAALAMEDANVAHVSLPTPWSKAEIAVCHGPASVNPIAVNMSGRWSLAELDPQIEAMLPECVLVDTMRSARVAKRTPVPTMRSMRRLVDARRTMDAMEALRVLASLAEDPIR